MTGPVIFLAALVILVWALILLAGTLMSMDLTGEDGRDADGEV